VLPVTESAALQRVTGVHAANNSAARQQQLTKLAGELQRLHASDSVAVQWLMGHGSSMQMTMYNSHPIYTVSQKTSHLWLAITLTHMNGF